MYSNDTCAYMWLYTLSENTHIVHVYVYMKGNAGFRD